MVATRADWKTTPFPTARAALQLDREYSAVEFERIKLGSVPREMEDKWFVFYEEPWLHFHRSWTGFGVYQVRFESVEGKSRVAEAFVSRDQEQYRSTNAKGDALLLAVLLDGHAGRNTETLWKEYLAAANHSG
jgi:hypothetical protein